MSKNNENKLVPKLRFPEFTNSKEWEAKEFSEYIVLYRGSSPRPIQNYLTKDVSGVNWIKIGDTQNAINYVIKNVEEKITTEGATKSRKVTIGELILANSMSFGKTYLLEIEGCIYDGWFVLREYEEHFNKAFLLQLLNSEHLQKQYKRLSAGGIVQNISSEIVYKTILAHTSFSEQQKIAACLSSLDEVITAESQKLEVLKDHKKGLLQNLLPQAGETVPKFRFKEFENSGEWQETTLTQVADYENGKAHEQDIADDGEFIVVNSKFISQDGEVKKFTNTAFLPATKGDVLMVLSDIPNGKAIAKCFLVEEDNRYTVNQRICRITPRNVNSKILYYLLNRNPYFLAFDDGVKQTNLRKDDVLNRPLLIPEDPKEQDKIADTLSSIDDLINAQNQKLEALQLHKKGLLQGLFPNLNEGNDG